MSAGLSSMSVADLRKEAKRLNVDLGKCLEKDDMVAMIERASKAQAQPPAAAPAAAKPTPNGTNGTMKPPRPPAANGSAKQPAAAAAEEKPKGSADPKLASALRLVDAIIGAIATRQRDPTSDATRMRVLKLVKMPEKYKGTERGSVQTAAGRKVAYRSMTMLLHPDKHQGKASERETIRLKLGFRVAEACMKEYGEEIIKTDSELEEAIVKWQQSASFKQFGQQQQRPSFGSGLSGFSGTSQPSEPEPLDITAESEWRCTPCGVRRLFGGAATGGAFAVRKFKCSHSKCGGKKQDWKPTGGGSCPPSPTPATPVSTLDPELEVFEVDEFEISSDDDMAEAPETPASQVPESPMPRFPSGVSFDTTGHAEGPGTPLGETNPAHNASFTSAASAASAASATSKKQKKAKHAGRKRTFEDSSSEDGPRPGELGQRAGSFGWGGGDELSAMLGGRKMQKVWSGKPGKRPRKATIDSDSSSEAPQVATHIQVTVPEGCEPGTRLQVQAAGMTIEAIVPEGVRPGEIFQAKIPEAEREKKEGKKHKAAPSGTPRAAPDPQQEAEQAADTGVNEAEEMLRKAQEHAAKMKREREKAEAARKLAEMEEDAKRRAAPEDALRQAQEELRKAQEAKAAAAAERQRLQDEKEAREKLDALAAEAGRRAAAHAELDRQRSGLSESQGDATPSPPSPLPTTPSGLQTPVSPASLNPFLAPKGAAPKPPAEAAAAPAAAPAPAPAPKPTVDAAARAAAQAEAKQQRIQKRKEERAAERYKQEQEEEAKRRRIEQDKRVKEHRRAERLLEKMMAKQTADHEKTLREARERAQAKADAREQQRTDAAAALATQWGAGRQLAAARRASQSQSQSGSPPPAHSGDTVQLPRRSSAPPAHQGPAPTLSRKSSLSTTPGTPVAGNPFSFASAGGGEDAEA